MPKTLDKKIKREARRYKVREDDLKIAFKVIHYVATGRDFDATLLREDIKYKTKDLWSAALNVQQYANEYIYTPNKMIESFE